MIAILCIFSWALLCQTESSRCVLHPPSQTVLAHTKTELLERLAEDTARIAEAPRCYSVSSSSCNSEVISREPMIPSLTEHRYLASYA